MKKKIFIAILCSCLIFTTFEGCGNSADSSSEESDFEVTESISKPEENLIYPVSIDSSLYDYATLPPNIIYTTTAEENGLYGNPYYVSGTVAEVVSAEDSDFGTRYFMVQGDNGKVYFIDFLDYSHSQDYTPEEIAAFEEVYNYDNTFPQEDEIVTVYGLYFGYSNVLNAPVFYFGLNENLYKYLLSANEDYSEETVTEESWAEESAAVEEATSEIASTETDQVAEEVAANQTAEESDSGSITVTLGMQNALSRARNYLKIMSFSYSELIEQLEYEGYSAEESTYAADNCGADWNEQAAKKAKDYLDIMPFSRSELIEQLEYEGFTSSQAEYGASAVGY